MNDNGSRAMPVIFGFLMLSFVLIVFLAMTVSSQRAQIEVLKQDAINNSNLLEQERELREYNDSHILLNDHHDLIEEGVVILSVDSVLVNPDQQIYEIANYEIGSFLMEVGGQYLSIPVVLGETVNLVTYRNAPGQEEIGYSKCYTNSSRCNQTIIETGISISSE